jgi:hypothetical protein
MSIYIQATNFYRPMGQKGATMLKINKLIKNGMKSDMNMFFRNIVSPIGNINLDRDASVNEIIASYVKESTLCKLDESTDALGNAYLSVAILLAFIERISSPLKKPSSIKEILDDDDLTMEDWIAECTGIVAKSIFEGYEERADKYLLYIAVLVKHWLEEEDCDFSDEDASSEDDDILEPLSETENAADSEQVAKPDEEPIPWEIGAPI